jgi:hypothetical protein
MLPPPKTLSTSGFEGSSMMPIPTSTLSPFAHDAPTCQSAPPGQPWVQEIPLPSTVTQAPLSMMPPPALTVKSAPLTEDVAPHLSKSSVPLPSSSNPSASSFTTPVTAAAERRVEMASAVVRHILEEQKKGPRSWKEKLLRFKAGITPEKVTAINAFPERKLEWHHTDRLDHSAAEHRDRFVKEMFGLSADAPLLEDKLAYVAICGTSPRSFRSMASHIATLIQAGCDLTSTGVARFYLIKQLSGVGYKNASVNVMKTNIHTFRKMVGLVSEEDYWHYFELGLGYFNPEGLRDQRGAITRSMLTQALDEPEIANTIYRDGYILQHAFGLRTAQVAGVRTDQITPQLATDGTIECFVFAGPKHKLKASYLKNEGELHYSDPAWNLEIIDIIEAAQARVSTKPRASVHGPQLVPDWVPHTANDKIKMIADRLGWDDALVWVNHCVRRGSAADAAAESEDQTVLGKVQAAQKRTAQRSHQVTQDYMLSNPENKHRAKAKKALVTSRTKPEKVVVGVTRVRGKLKQVVAVAPSMKKRILKAKSSPRKGVGKKRK